MIRGVFPVLCMFSPAEQEKYLLRVPGWCWRRRMNDITRSQQRAQFSFKSNQPLSHPPPGLVRSSEHAQQRANLTGDDDAPHRPASRSSFAWAQSDCLLCVGTVNVSGMLFTAKRQATVQVTPTTAFSGTPRRFLTLTASTCSGQATFPRPVFTEPIGR